MADQKFKDMTIEQVKATLHDMAKVLDSSLKTSLDATSGPRAIQVIHRQLIPMGGLDSENLLVAKAADEIRAYLAAWPSVDALKSTAEFTTAGASRIYHQEPITDHAPLSNVPYASISTERGRLEAMLLWNCAVLSSELVFVVTCVPA